MAWVEAAHPVQRNSDPQFSKTRSTLKIRVNRGKMKAMKKVAIIILVLICGGIGFLVYDWHVKTTIRNDDQRVTLYSWTDAKGAKHYTNTQPPDGARNVEERKGYKYVDPPLAMKIKDKSIELYQWIKAKIFKPKAKKPKRGKE